MDQAGKSLTGDVEVEDCVTCGHRFTAHKKDDFNACIECECSAYWDSEDDALANAS
jgi:predicted  nucleic acid-binding Zn-ribbon protein